MLRTISRRSLSKKQGPGRWSCPVAGHVDEGEDYETTVLRETREELGLTLVPSDLTLGPKLLLVEPGFDFFCQFYRYTADVSIDDLTPQKEEIEQLSWFSRDRLRLDLQSDTEKFVITASQWLPQLLGN